jgi:hypothetical protein
MYATNAVCIGDEALRKFMKWVLAKKELEAYFKCNTTLHLWNERPTLHTYGRWTGVSGRRRAPRTVAFMRACADPATRLPTATTSPIEYRVNSSRTDRLAPPRAAGAPR